MSLCNKMKGKKQKTKNQQNTTLSEQFQNQISKS
jgi:hypothetical protein